MAGAYNLPLNKHYTAGAYNLPLNKHYTAGAYNLPPNKHYITDAVLFLWEINVNTTYLSLAQL
jgi:hypothetical protein